MSTPSPEPIDVARERVRAEAQEARARHEALRALASTVAQITGTARSRDGRIRVTASTGGMVTAIEITDDAADGDGAALGRELVALIAGAQRDALERAAAASAEQLGDAHPLVADLAGSAQRFGGPTSTLSQG